MKTTVRTLKSEKGFSLIELMIVVAIIGILATIAIPNFTKMQAKAKQSEARANLSGVFTAQKSFFAEWSTYYGVFADIGYVPEGKMNYIVSNGGAGTAPGGTFVASTGVGSGATCFISSCAGLKVTTTAAAVATGNPAVTPTATTFVAGASSQLIPGAAVDLWTMDQDRQLKNSQPGI
jgi:type IV pilus assembly protein PilA